jgi:hypothetical protein
VLGLLPHGVLVVWIGLRLRPAPALPRVPAQAEELSRIYDDIADFTGRYL